MSEGGLGAGRSGGRTKESGFGVGGGVAGGEGFTGRCQRGKRKNADANGGTIAYRGRSTN